MKVLYGKGCTETIVQEDGCTGNIVQESFVQKMRYRTMLYRKGCTGKELHRKCTGNAV